MTITPADAADLLADVAIAHRRTAPRPTNADEALRLADAWAAIFNVHRLTMPLLRQALVVRAADNLDAPEPAELVAVARKIRQDRLDRDPAAREAILEQIDAKIAALESRPLRAELEARAGDDGRLAG